MWSKAVCLLMLTSIAGLTLSGPAPSGSFVNGIVDKIIKKISKTLIADGYEPLPLPPYTIKLLGLGFVGKLELYDCQFYNLSTLYRSQDVEYEQVNKTLHITTAVGFDKLKLNCTYKASLLSLGLKRGKAVVNIPRLTASADLDLDLGTLKPHLNDLKLENDGPLDVHLEGGIIDGLLSLLTEAISNLFQTVILNYTEGKLEDEIRKILEGTELRNEVQKRDAVNVYYTYRQQ